MGAITKLFGRKAERVAQVGPEEARDLLRQGALLVDVREPAEWQAGHAPKARHVPLGSLAGAMGSLPQGRTLVVVCRSGNRSGRAAKHLASSGFDVVNLAGGMQAWRRAGQPVVSSKGRPGRVA